MIYSYRRCNNRYRGFYGIIENGFVLNRFDEHPSWTNESLTGEFTIIAKKN